MTIVSAAANLNDDDRHLGSRRISARPRLFRFDSPRSRKMKINSMRFAAPLVAALSSLMAGSPPALASAPQIHDQAPGFFRLKVGDLEVTALICQRSYSEAL
jgi:hypothetical protein